MPLHAPFEDYTLHFFFFFFTACQLMPRMYLSLRLIVQP